MVMPQHGGPEVLVAEQVERPSPAAGEVLIEMAAAGLNPVDTQVRAGSWVPDAMGRPPMILGWDVAGVIAELGDRMVSSLEPGDRVFGMPSFPELARCDAEYVIAREEHIARAPAALGDEQAGALPLAGLTAWQALDRAGVQEGDRVLVQAAGGGVGHLAVQIAKARGAHVIGTARPEKHDLLCELGVDEPVDYTAGPLDQAVSAVDVVIELVSEDDEGLTASLGILRRGGRLVVIAGDLTERLRTVAEEQGKDATEMLVAPERAALESLASLANAGRLNVHIDAAFALDRAPEAHRRQESGRVTGKLVLTP